MSVLLHYYRGRVALHAILKGLGAGPGDEIVIQAYTCAAVVEPLLRLGVRPVYADISRDTFGIDPAGLSALLTPRTRAIVAQHTFGIPAPMAAITEIGRSAGVPVVEDCAHMTPGTVTPGGSVASFWSYEWGKPVVAGVGGTAVVHDPGLAAEMRSRYHRYTSPPPLREAMMAAEYLAYRVAAGTGMLWRLRSLYRQLSGLGVVTGSYAPDPVNSPEYGWRMSRTVRWRLPNRIDAGRMQAHHRRRVTGQDLPYVPHRIPVIVGDKQRVLREAAKAGLEVGDWFTTPVHPLAGPDLAAAGYTPGSCPNAEWAAAHVVTLPVRPETRHADIQHAVALLSRIEASVDA
ncbi:dTDP-4-amino-4,6-dideoxygalactose transaminase [Actinoplanes lutulentus]|uniref:dTDP-4-amino-4,6-dideoxygalactose transaminase n=1 Tax=Actinoplanes lutulentus TaxID=1287878 RepID=A0A327ZIA0_9ACTN|nr:DegT/DnrJ/EryC1/StrS family aminotransferase [Actinoplanes lutulentus]MBB2944348.1 dTDP-4-amino-4,6-dideoxygalactose transaminase [Actinoplanes lutulentus]RAK42419.1 dTDP-4-amino-4,6-dideoxygalactose transaminase [Actinoplanes lutulentus]